MSAASNPSSRSVPREALAVPRGNERYWFHGGQWYRHDGPGFVVVAPPVGLIVPVLPSLYVTLNIGGVPYYYANDTYYSYNPAAAGYEVVAPPEGIESASALPPTQATPAGNGVQVRIGGAVVLGVPMEALNGAAVAAVRPEDLTVAPDGPIAVTVEAAEYRGRDFYGFGRTQDDTELFFRSDRRVGNGDAVRLAVRHVHDVVAGRRHRYQLESTAVNEGVEQRTTLLRAVLVQHHSGNIKHFKRGGVAKQKHLNNGRHKKSQAR